MKYSIFLLLILGLSSCAAYKSSIEATVDGLNKRNLSSCVYWEGHAGPYINMRGYSRTGPIENILNCDELWERLH